MRYVALCVLFAVAGGVPPDWVYLQWGEMNEDELLPTSPAKVSIVEELPEGCVKGGTVPFAIPGGIKYHCCKAERGAEQAATYAEAQGYLEASAVKGVQSLLIKHRITGLTWETSQWWSYELCFNNYIRQYHAEDSVIKSEFILGLGASAPAGGCPTALHYESPKERVDHKIALLVAQNQKSDRAAPSSAWRFKGSMGDAPYLTSLYTNGEKCDLTGQARSVEVRLHCRQGTSPAFNISETEDCKYVAHVSLEGVCDFEPYVKVEEYLNKDAEVLPYKEKMERAIRRRDDVLRARSVPTVYEAIVKDLGPLGCITLTTDGWWTYELCMKYWLRQYHEAEGVIHDEFFIGRGVLANRGNDAIMSKTREYKLEGAKQMRSMRSRSVVKERLQANGTWTAHGEAGNYYFKTQMANGQVCDITGQPREVEIQLYCKNDVDRTFSVLEVATCKYEAKVYLLSVCQLEAYRHLVEGDTVRKEARPVKLLCAPEDPKLAKPLKEEKQPPILAAPRTHRG